MEAIREKYDYKKAKERKKDFGCLIERKKQGQGKPDMIYVKNFVIEDEPRSLDDEPLEVCNSNPNNTENNYNNINNTNPILYCLY